MQEMKKHGYNIARRTSSKISQYVKHTKCKIKAGNIIMEQIRSTTVLGIRRNGKIAIAGDGQVTIGIRL